MAAASRTDTYSELKLFIETMAAFRDERFPGPISMAASLQETLAAAERRRRRIPISGLRDAAHDMVVWSRHAPAAVRREADAYLEARGAVTLTAMIGRVSRVVPRILSSKRIRNEERSRKHDA